mmetsp:Transcript_21866/g.38676  ORF Transcript_21866/g.38676 Transcript_21866/m.38676 type:complete len:218 (+) Transcript_21866:1192-1845(+)
MGNIRGEREHRPLFALACIKVSIKVRKLDQFGCRLGKVLERAGTQPPKAHGSARVPCGSEPVISMPLVSSLLRGRVGVCHDNTNRAILEIRSSVTVHVNTMVAIVQTFHPMIVELKVPRSKVFRGHCANNESFVVFYLPIRMVVSNKGVSTDRIRAIDVEQWKLVAMVSLELICPFCKHQRGAGHKQSTRPQCVVYSRCRAWRRKLIATHTFDLDLG